VLRKLNGTGLGLEQRLNKIKIIIYYIGQCPSNLELSILNTVMDVFVFENQILLSKYFSKFNRIILHK